MKVAVYIGRFQPFHYGHKAVIDELLKQFDKVLILIGTSSTSSDRNPIPSSNVKDSIAFNYYRSSPIVYRYLFDKDSNFDWINSIDHLCSITFPEDTEFTLAIHNKPSEAGKYGLPSGTFISDYILSTSKIINSSVDMSSLSTLDIDATTIRETMRHLLALAPKVSLTNLLNNL